MHGHKPYILLKVVMGAKSLGINMGLTQNVMMELAFDNAKYTKACIESIDCVFCSGGDCLDAKSNFYNLWNEVVF